MDKETEQWAIDRKSRVFFFMDYKFQVKNPSSEIAEIESQQWFGLLIKKNQEKQRKQATKSQGKTIIKMNYP